MSGSGLLLNVQPAPPAFASAYDFDLLEPVTGRGCSMRGDEGTSYWVAIPGLERGTFDAVTNQAIGAAAFNAVSGLRGADTVLLMRVVTEGEGERVCATVYGRGVAVRKAGVSAEANAGVAAPTDARDLAIPALDRDLITLTVQSVMREILQCATFDHGKVKVAVTVAPSGLVTSAIVTSGPPGELGVCVANELKKVVFPPSRTGGTFSYPFNL